jgi:hypothetical protein
MQVDDEAIDKPIVSADVGTMMLMHQIIKEIEQDQNLRMLPDPLKELAVQMTLNEMRYNQGCPGEDVNDNKRSRNE